MSHKTVKFYKNERKQEWAKKTTKLLEGFNDLLSSLGNNALPTHYGVKNPLWHVMGNLNDASKSDAVFFIPIHLACGAFAVVKHFDAVYSNTKWILRFI